MSRHEGEATPTDAHPLAAVRTFLAQYLAMPNQHYLTVLTLWAAHTHAEDAFYVTPRLIIESAEPGSGKTRILELLALLVKHPEMTISATVAAIFRMLADHPYTLLFDEIDAIFNPKNGGNYEDLRALLNAGYKRGATIARCVGDAKSMKVQRFTVFAPVALAGLAGRTPATIATRGITLSIRKRARTEKVAPFRERDAEVESAPIREALEAWIATVRDDLESARPRMPAGVEDRPAEVWEALLAVADAAGGEWPKLARDACGHFVLDAKPEELSLGVRLLHDVHRVFRPKESEENPRSQWVDRMSSADLVSALLALPESPWVDLYGKPLDQVRLARELKRYSVEPRPLKIDGKSVRGYETGGEIGLIDAWKRYLPDFRVTDVTPVTTQVRGSRPVTPPSAVTPPPVTSDEGVTDGKVLTSKVTDVTGVTPKTCSTCARPLMLITPGRTTCERCRLVRARVA